MEKFDVCVIGAGPSGYAAAMRALDLGLKVLIIEKAKVGGAGLYDGALSSKTLWELSKDVFMARKRVNKYSVCKDFMVDFGKIKLELKGAIEERKNQLEGHLESLKEEGATPMACSGRCDQPVPVLKGHETYVGLASESLERRPSPLPCLLYTSPSPRDA